MKLREVFSSNYVKATDLQNRDVTVVISDAKVEKLGEDRKLVLYFQGKEKGLVTNKTNANRIAYMYGEDTDEWIGKEIVLFTDMVDFQGRTVEAIRVRAPAKRGNAPPQQQAKRQNVVTDRGGYKLSEMRDPIEEATGSPTRDPMDSEIPF